MAIFDEKIEIGERCKGVHCVDLGESFPTRIYLQKSASIQPRTSPSKFGEKFNSLFTSLLRSPAFLNAKGVLEGGQLYLYRAPTGHWVMGTPIGATLRTPVNNIEYFDYFPPNFEGLVLGCIDANFCK